MFKVTYMRKDTTELTKLIKDQKEFIDYIKYLEVWFEKGEVLCYDVKRF